MLLTMITKCFIFSQSVVPVISIYKQHQKVDVCRWTVQDKLIRLWHLTILQSGNSSCDALKSNSNVYLICIYFCVLIESELLLLLHRCQCCSFVYCELMLNWQTQERRLFYTWVKGGVPDHTSSLFLAQLGQAPSPQARQTQAALSLRPQRFGI